MQKVNSYGKVTVVVANHTQYLIDLYFYLLSNPPEADRSGGGAVLGRAKKTGAAEIGALHRRLCNPNSAHQEGRHVVSS